MYLYGASGHAKVIIEILELTGKTVAGLFDDNCEIKEIWEYKVSSYSKLAERNGVELIISIGSNSIRKKLALTLKHPYQTAIHPAAVISARSIIGEGSVVMAGVVINADVNIGSHCIINTNASVDHDCKLGDFVHISPNSVLCGGVNVGEGAHIGAGAIVIPGIKIGAWAVIGAGAVVLKDVEDGVTMVGNPAKNKLYRNI